MDKVKSILEKANGISEDLRSITFKDYKGTNVEGITFNNEVKGIRLEMLWLQDRIEALVRYVEGEFSCGGCGKWFKPLDVTKSNEDYFCPDCEGKFREEMESESLFCLLYDDGLVVDDEVKKHDSADFWLRSGS
ncbi:hypothetical protein AAC978_05695 [Desulfitobacterium sp. THU1]|uniref:hypothetical protein n=1 Tax=Desulfitobacterium sp. THU1 TaxID=3138072 RepID=UPI00311E1ACA